MADVKRLHYFNHQFLVEADFTDEQQYHLTMRRRHNEALHTYGVAGGLAVEKTGDTEITVQPGMAIDRAGHELVLLDPRVAGVSGSSESTVTITIAYHEEESDPSTATGVTGNTRITENPEVQAVATATPADGSVIRLAQFVLDSAGNVPGNVGDTFSAGRQAAGTLLADGSISEAKLANSAVTTAKIADNTINANKLDATTQGKLVTNGNNHDHSGGNGAQIKHSTLNLDDGTNPHGTTAAQVGALVSVDGVSNPGGNIDLIPANAITIVPDTGNRWISIGENHSTRTDNPHNTTAAQVGAVPISGGVITGGLTVAGGTARLGDPNIGTAQHAFGMDAGKTASVFISAQQSPNVSGGGKTCLMIWPVLDGVSALNIISASSVDTMVVSGTARFTGTKIGYVADTFVNGSGKVLHTGDVVKLKSSVSIRFHGDNNCIPIAEVTLADSDNDPLVIGLVAQEATPAADEPDNRSDPADSTSIPDGGELFVVTLGTFAHCKVDATQAPIAIGDLLTSSANPGHARKATDPKIGSIIGKALEPLKEGTGYIAVFVNIQ